MSEEEVREVEGVLAPAGVPANERALIALDKAAGETLLSTNKPEDEEQFQALGEAVQLCAGRMKATEKRRKDLLSPFRDFVTKVNAEYKTATDALDKGIRHAKANISTYQHEVAERQRKAAEAEAARIQKNAEARAETQRKKEEAAVKAAEEAAKAAEAATSDFDKQAAQEEQEAAEAEAVRRAEEAEQIRMEAEMEAENAKAAVATQAAPKAKGVSSRKNWKGEVIDLPAFLKAVAAGNDPRLKAELLKVNQPALNKLVKALEDGLKDVPGLRVFYEDVVSVRSSK